MKPFNIILWLFVAIMMIASCASPQKSFNKGNYEKAYKAALKNIKKGKKNRKDKTLLNKSFNEILKERSNNIDRYSSSSIIEDWEEAYKEYDELIDLYYDGKQYLDNDYDTVMDQKQVESDKLRDDIATNFADLGHMRMEQFESSSNKRLAQEAFEFYKKTEYYNPQYDSIQSLLTTSYESAIVSVYVEAESRWDYTYNWVIDRKFSDIERESQGYYQISYERNQALADCTLQLEFSGLDENRRERRNTESFSERIQDGYETRQDTSGNTTQIPKYITVTGQVTTIREIYNYRWQVRVNSYGPRDYCDFRNRTFDAEEEIVNEVYEISGDRRAIPNNYSNNNFNQRDLNDVIDNLLDELYRDVENYYF